MSEQADKRAKLGLGHWIALGGVALSLVILVVQMILIFTTELFEQRPGAGTVINTILQTGLLGLLLAGAVIVLFMALRNARLYALVYILGGAIAVVHAFSVLNWGMYAPVKSAGLTAYFLVGLAGLVVGACAASGCLALPTGKDVQGVAEELRHEEAPAPDASGEAPPQEGGAP
jgi:hypothetical protein